MQEQQVGISQNHIKVKHSSVFEITPSGLATILLVARIVGQFNAEHREVEDARLRMCLPVLAQKLES